MSLSSISRASNQITHQYIYITVILSPPPSPIHSLLLPLLSFSCSLSPLTLTLSPPFLYDFLSLPSSPTLLTISALLISNPSPSLSLSVRALSLSLCPGWSLIVLSRTLMIICFGSQAEIKIFNLCWKDNNGSKTLHGSQDVMLLNSEFTCISKMYIISLKRKSLMLTKAAFVCSITVLL